MVISPFLFLGLSVGIGYLQGSSMAKNSKVAVVTTVPSVAEGLRDTNGINFDYQDEVSAQAAIKDEKIKGYLTIDQEDSVIKAVYHGETSLESAIKLGVTSKLNELQAQLNRSAANLSQEQEKRLAQTVDFTEKIDESKENKKLVQTIAAAGLGFFLYMILITYASVTAQEVASEKGTKIMEVVFSSIQASHYFYARMIGKLKQSGYLYKYSEEARAVLEILLDKYMDKGIGELESIETLKLPEFQIYGGTFKIINTYFGDKKRYLQAIKELEKELFTVA